MLNQFIQLEVDRRGWVVNPAMIAFFGDAANLLI